MIAAESIPPALLVTRMPPVTVTRLHGDCYALTDNYIVTLSWPNLNFRPFAGKSELQKGKRGCLKRFRWYRPKAREKEASGKAKRMIRDLGHQDVQLLCCVAVAESFLNFEVLPVMTK